jgi:hypothetical protein
MFTSILSASSVKSWLARKTLIAVSAFTAIVLSASAANANSNCQRVVGFVEEAPLSGPACLSPVGLCTQFNFRGVLRGDGEFTAATFITTTDTTTTGVVFSTGDSVIHARIGSRQGDLIVKPAAVYHTAGEGELLDIQTIVGGTGDFSGASGVLRVVGNFLFPDGGTSAYDGSVCTP